MTACPGGWYLLQHNGELNWSLWMAIVCTKGKKRKEWIRCKGNRYLVRVEAILEIGLRCKKRCNPFYLVQLNRGSLNWSWCKRCLIVKYRMNKRLLRNVCICSMLIIHAIICNFISSYLKYHTYYDYTYRK